MLAAEGYGRWKNREDICDLVSLAESGPCYKSLIFRSYRLIQASARTYSRKCLQGQRRTSSVEVSLDACDRGRVR